MCEVLQLVQSQQKWIGAKIQEWTGRTEMLDACATSGKKTIAGAKYDVIQYGCRTDTNMVKADRDPSRKINACTEQEGAAAAAEKGNGDKNGGKDKGRLFAVLFASGMTVLVGILLLWM